MKENNKKSEGYENFLKGFSERLSKARNNKQLSKSALAKMVGFSSPVQIFRYENGENFPDPFVLLKISKALDIDLHWLITGDDPFEKALKTIVAADLEAVRRQHIEQYTPARKIALDLEQKEMKGLTLTDTEKASLQKAKKTVSILSDRLLMLNLFFETQYRIKALLENINRPLNDD